MKRRRRPVNRDREPMRVIKLWTYPQAQKALPYFRSVLGSLREHWLHTQNSNRELQREAKVPGRPDRHTLIQHELLVEDKAGAESEFSDALHELMRLDIYLLDPVRGLAVIPFAKEERLAWYLFDLFDPEGMSAWRFHEDDLEVRRPLAEALAEPPAPPTAT